MYPSNNNPIKIQELAPNTVALQISKHIPPTNQKNKLTKNDSSTNNNTKNIKIKLGLR